MTVPDKVVELVERFRANESIYRSPDYKEAHIRQDFIDPFFAALGWDLRNEQNALELYKEVIFEDAIKIGGSTKAPDYCFRIGGNRKFFVEAKKPSVNLSDNVSAAFQVRRYGWSAKLLLSILTDFEEFAVYDCRVMPKKDDQAAIARSLYISYTEYVDRWEEIYALFSKQAVLAGSLERFADQKKPKRGTTTVDAAFLKEIELWREQLAIALSANNAGLKPRELNFAVQMTINRLIFLRICEDRGIEPYEQLRSLMQQGQIYEQLCRLFRLADDRYNSGLFHFKPEKNRPDADEFTLSLTIPDQPLQHIIQNFYYPDSPYEFSVIPIEILGQVYEQFLGKVICLNSEGEAIVEDKPEVRKAGGVYYTPTYIVDYIVENTIGQLLEGKTPKQAEKIRVLDPACGSGSFLIGAYQFLLDWYLQQYSTNPQKFRKQLYQGSGGGFRLTSDEKKRILLNHIHGVDIDLQAVETTKLSLLLKVLEGESQETISRQLSLLRTRALPDLDKNIKCGNSLIDSEFYSGQLSLLDEETSYRVNIFDWEAAFSEVIKSGGFDVIIGNPPYIRIQVLKEWASLEVEFYKRAYVTASKGNYDIYVVFVEKGMELLNDKGILGFILPHKFFNAQYGESLRGVISKNDCLAKVVHFGHEQVFVGATTYTCLLFLNQLNNQQCKFVKVNNLSEWRVSGEAEEGYIASETITSKDWNFTIGGSLDVFTKLQLVPVRLGDLAERISQGIRTSANEVYVLELVTEGQNLIEAYSEKLERVVMIEPQSVSKFLQGREIKPYQILSSGKIIFIPYQFNDGKASLFSESYLSERFPNMLNYLLENKTHLENRERGKMNGSNWYAYVYPKNLDLMRTQKILVPDIASKASFALDETGEYAFTSGYGITLKSNVQESIKYVLGLLNSKLLDFYLKKVSTVIRGGFFRYFTQFVEQLPIHPINFDDRAEKVKHDRIVQLVEQMISLHKQLANAKTPPQKNMIQQQIKASDRQIDQLVYELYELTPEEIAIVEGR